MFADFNDSLEELPDIRYRFQYGISEENWDGVEPDLWSKVRQEYLFYYPDCIIKVLKVEKSLTYKDLKDILKELNIPIYLGFVLKAITDLEERNIVLRKGIYVQLQDNKSTCKST